MEVAFIVAGTAGVCFFAEDKLAAGALTGTLASLGEKTGEKETRCEEKIGGVFVGKAKLGGGEQKQGADCCAVGV